MGVVFEAEDTTLGRGLDVAVNNALGSFLVEALAQIPLRCAAFWQSCPPPNQERERLPQANPLVSLCAGSAPPYTSRSNVGRLQA